MNFEQSIIQVSVTAFLTSRPLSVARAAQLLGVPERTVRHWARNGKLKATRVGKKIWQFQRSDVLAFKKGMEVAYA